MIQFILVLGLLFANIGASYDVNPSPQDEARLHDARVIAAVAGLVWFVAATAALLCWLVPRTKPALGVAGAAIVLLLGASGAGLVAAFWVRMDAVPSPYYWVIDIGPVVLSVAAAASCLQRRLSRRRPRPSPA